ncbi:MAG: polysaccharide deacetylase family protein [Bacteroidales bacterium]
MLFPEAIWRIRSKKGRTVYLTFDDGPIPSITPWVLDLLDKYGIKGTFFCVGDNVKRYPEIYADIVRRGHSVGNHTMNHLQGVRVSTERYLDNIAEAAKLIDSHLYRPPHGLLRSRQARKIKEHFQIIMYDLVTRDYSRNLNGEQVFDNIKHYTRDGSIIVFHDSLKAENNLRYALPRAIEWLQDNGYKIKPIGMY